MYFAPATMQASCWSSSTMLSQRVVAAPSIQPVNRLITNINNFYRETYIHIDINIQWIIFCSKERNKSVLKTGSSRTLFKPLFEKFQLKSKKWTKLIDTHLRKYVAEFKIWQWFIGQSLKLTDFLKMLIFTSHWQIKTFGSNLTHPLGSEYLIFTPTLACPSAQSYVCGVQ